MRALASFARWELAVDVATPASSASSVAVSAIPLISAMSMRARAGSPNSRANAARSRSSRISLPFLCDAPAALEIVDHHDQTMIVIAVLRDDVDAGFRHATSDLPQLSR